MTDPPAVSASGLVKRFGAVTALHEVGIAVASGEVRGLLGPNGAGKTTLLRALFGLIALDAGRVELLGRPLDRIERARLDGVAGFVEEPAFYPYLTGRANLRVLASLDGAGAAARIDDALERVGLGRRGEDRVNGYSTGMRQRLGIAAALVRSPRVLLLDEPTAGLDPGGVRDVLELIGGLARDGLAVLLSSHQIDEVESACDTFTVLRRGEVVWESTAEELRTRAGADGFLMQTSDDPRALQLAGDRRGLSVARSATGGGLEVTADASALDAYVLALAADGVAVRRLELSASRLEAMFYSLTA